jgi:arylsulfatase A
MFLPGARGFDTYLGIPYSDDMGSARRSPCPGQKVCPADGRGGDEVIPASDYVYTVRDNVHGTLENLADLNSRDPADLSPLVFQSGGVSSTPGAQTQTGAYAQNTTVVEQPLDFTTLSDKYNNFVLDFIERSKDDPFFLYMPFSRAPRTRRILRRQRPRPQQAATPHDAFVWSSRTLPLCSTDVHTTAGNQPQKQYAGCDFQNTSKRGAFGDALSEVDHVIGNVRAKVSPQGLEALAFPLLY